MSAEEDVIETRLALSVQNWKEKVENYQYVIDALKNNCSTHYFDSNPNALMTFINENNAFALEKALEMIICYLRISEIGKRNIKSELRNFIEKCFKSSRQQTRSWGIDIFILQCEKSLIEVIECLNSCLTDNRPTIVNGVLETLIIIIKEFKIVSIKKLLNSFPKLFESRDQQTRTLVKNLTVDIGRKYGKHVIESLLKELKPIHANDINTDLDKVIPLNSEALCIKCEEEEVIEVQTLNDIPFYEILPLLKADFFERLDGSKQERKDSLDFLYENILNKRLSTGNYRELVKKLCHIVVKDSQINSVMIAIKILTEMAKSLAKNFTIYSLSVIEACLEKFKEKKPTVISLVRQCIDAAYATTTIESCLATIVEVLDNKNPTVRLETVSFLLRLCVDKRSSDSVKKQLKQLISVLRKLCDDSVLEIRDQTFQLIGQLWCANNARMIEGVLEGLDTVKMQRIKSFINKDNFRADVICEAPVVVAVEKKTLKIIPKAAPPKIVKEELPKKKLEQPLKQQKETFLSESDFESKCLSIFGSDCVKKLTSALWQNRLAVLDSVMECLKKTEIERTTCQITVRFMLAKPGLKESNLAVLRKKMEILLTVFRDHRASAMVAELCVADVVEKLGDLKVGTICKSMLEILFGTIADLGAVTARALQATIESKSARSNTELLDWLAQYLNNCDHRVMCPKEVIPFIRQLLSSTNVAVKHGTITLIGAIYKRSGHSIIDAFDSEKPSIVEMIQKEMAKIDLLKKEEKQIEKIKLQMIVNNERLIKADSEVIVPERVEPDTKGKLSEAMSVNGSVCESGTVIKDDARGFVLDLCDRLSLYINQYTAPTLELELREIFSSILEMNDRRKESVFLLKASLMDNNISKSTIFTQTDSVECMSANAPSINTPTRDYITTRRSKKPRIRLENCVIEESNDENEPLTQYLETKANVFKERNKEEIIVAEQWTMSRISKVLQNQSDSSNISDALSRLIEMLKSDSKMCHDTVALLPSLANRLETICSNDRSENIRTTELEQIISILSTVYLCREAVSSVTDECTVQLLHSLFTIINNNRAHNNQTATDLVRALNTATMHIVESTELARILYSLAILLDRYFESGTYKNSISTMIVKIFWNRTKKVNVTVHLSEDYLYRLFEVVNGQFIKYFNDEDVVNSIAFKSVKTLINTLTKLKGLDLVRYVPNHDNQNLKKYISYCHEREN